MRRRGNPTSHLWFPRQFLVHEWKRKRGYLVGFNVAALQTSVITVVDASQVFVGESLVVDLGNASHRHEPLPTIDEVDEGSPPLNSVSFLCR